jgi:hypothetical protein
MEESKPKNGEEESPSLTNKFFHFFTNIFTAGGHEESKNLQKNNDNRIDNEEEIKSNNSGIVIPPNNQDVKLPINNSINNVKMIKKSSNTNMDERKDLDKLQNKIIESAVIKKSKYKTILIM